MDLDFEELSLPLCIVFLVCGLLSIALIYVNAVSYTLDFYLFIFSIACLISSVLCLGVNFIYMWQAEEPYPYYPVERSSEQSHNNLILRTDNSNPQKTKTVSVAPPTREELHQLKDALGIEKGSLQYKRRGASVYHVLYNEGKYRWTHIGPWNELREKLDKENSVE